MGAWDNTPWDNDDAYQWFISLFEKIDLREEVMATFNRDIPKHYEAIRAAASMLMFLGRIYIWPSEHIDEDVSLAIRKMKEIKKYISENKPNHFNEDIEHGIDHEIAILKHHYSKFNKLPPTPEFANYWLSLLRNGSDYQRGGFLNCFKKKIRIKES